MLEAKSQGLTKNVAPYVDRLGNAGIWLSDDIRERILTLAGEE
jgi:predicted nucleic acid-binding protein